MIGASLQDLLVCGFSSPVSKEIYLDTATSLIDKTSQLRQPMDSFQRDNVEHSSYNHSDVYKNHAASALEQHQQLT